jgi:hypothetical protein
VAEFGGSRRRGKVVATADPCGHTERLFIVLFFVTALLIPPVLKLPRWVEYEIVLGVWWVFWIGLLTYFLTRGFRVTDDHTLGAAVSVRREHRPNPHKVQRGSPRHEGDGHPQLFILSSMPGRPASATSVRSPDAHGAVLAAGGQP